MRYSDLDVAFNDKEVWKTDFTTLNHGPRWSDIDGQKDRLRLMKEKVKADMDMKLHGAIDAAENEEQIGTNLYPVLEMMNKGFFMAESSDTINTDLLLQKANKNTLEKKLQGWAHQLNQNVPIIKKRPGIKIFHNKLKDVPCVIVSAGPSLKNSIEKLRALKGKALIMALGTTFRPCISRNIIPDFVNAHDANGPNPGGGGGPRFFKGAYAKETIALFVNYIYPGTIAAYEGPQCYYYVDDPGISVYKTMALACDGSERPDGSFMESSIIGGSSVAHTAMYAAIAFGCNPITFVGLDLSYPDLKNSHFESDNAKNVRTQRLVDVVGVNGRKLKTNLSFYSYATVFNRMAPYMSIMKNVDLFNSSENDDGTPAGIVHYGLKPMKLDDWIAQYATANRPALQTILPEYWKYHKE